MYFLLDTPKISPNLGKIFKSICKVLFWLFQKVLCIMYFWATISKTSTSKNTGFRYYFVDAEIFLFIHDISRTVKSKAY